MRQAIRFVPNAITLGAVLCGLIALRLSAQGRFDLAIAAILGAALLDVVDGFAARRLAAVSAVGAELDSLADFLNFGVAPAMLLYDQHLHALGVAGFFIAAAYVLATGLRLARFNVQSLAPPAAHPKKWFKGLPSTGAALAVIAVDATATITLQAAKAPPLLAGATLTASALMLSTLRVPTVFTLFAGQKKH